MFVVSTLTWTLANAVATWCHLQDDRLNGQKSCHVAVPGQKGSFMKTTSGKRTFQNSHYPWWISIIYLFQKHLNVKYQKWMKNSASLKLNIDFVQMFSLVRKEVSLCPCRQDDKHTDDSWPSMEPIARTLAVLIWEVSCHGICDPRLRGSPLSGWTLVALLWICIQRKVWSTCLPTIL